MFLVSFHGFWKARYFPFGESCSPEISGLPKINSRSISGGKPPGEAFSSLVFCAPSDDTASTRHKGPLSSVFIATDFLSIRRRYRWDPECFLEDCGRKRPLLSTNLAWERAANRTGGSSISSTHSAPLQVTAAVFWDDEPAPINENATAVEYSNSGNAQIGQAQCPTNRAVARILATIRRKLLPLTLKSFAESLIAAVWF